MSSMNQVADAVAEALESQQVRIKVMEKQLCDFVANGAKPNSGGAGPSLGQKVWESEEFKSFARHGKGRMVVNVPDLSLKTTITGTTVGSGSSGVLMPQRTGGVVTEARRALRMRDLLTVYPCSSNAVDFVRITAGMTKASPVAEGDVKPENSLGFESVSETVRTIATWVPCSKQILEDLGQLRATIDSSLVFAVQGEEEREILFGDGSGLHLHGLTHQAQSFDLSILTASDGYEYVDIIEAAVTQIAADNELPSDFVVLHPNDWHKIRRTKESTGAYIFGPPSGGMPNRLWELQVVPTSLMTQGSFLVGSSSPQACAIFERQGMTVEITDGYEDYFVRNLLAARGECRTALVVFRPNSLCFGSLTQSPV